MLKITKSIFVSSEASCRNKRKNANKLFAEWAITHGHIEFVITLIAPSSTPRKNITMNEFGEKCSSAKARDDIERFIIIPYFFKWLITTPLKKNSSNNGAVMQTAKNPKIPSARVFGTMSGSPILNRKSNIILNGAIKIFI